jgi:menaquinone-dependent protoporphyrinogen IX oxidase
MNKFELLRNLVKEKHIANKILDYEADIIKVEKTKKIHAQLLKIKKVAIICIEEESDEFMDNELAQLSWEWFDTENDWNTRHCICFDMCLRCNTIQEYNKSIIDHINKCTGQRRELTYNSLYTQLSGFQIDCGYESDDY